MLDILKIIFCTPFLLYSCYSDIKTRRVSDSVWYIMILGGIIFLSYHLSVSGLFYLLYVLISFGLIYLFIEMYERISTLFHIRMMGGADAKLLFILSIIFPFYPTFKAFNHVFPLFIPSNFFVFSVLGDAVALAMIIPIVFAVYNLIKVGLCFGNHPLYIFLGYRAKISELTNKRVWIIQDFEEKNGKISSYYKRGGIEIDGEAISKLKNLLKKGLIKDEVWVTPKVPFMIPLSAGFFLAVFYGDLIFELMKYLILR